MTPQTWELDAFTPRGHTRSLLVRCVVASPVKATVVPQMTDDAALTQTS